MDSEVEPPKKTNPSPPSLLSLPDEIVVNCLARISRSYYPKLSLICKTLRSLVISSELTVARFHLKTTEIFFCVCLHLPNRRPSWFTLGIKPNKTLTNDLDQYKKSSESNTLFVRLPSSYSSSPASIVSVGSEQYAFSQTNGPSTVMRVRKKGALFWRKAPNMKVARECAVARVLNEKIYVMGGCGANESTNWAEVFDSKTQTWEPLPDPGVEIRSSKIKTVEVTQGEKLYVRSNNEKDYVYDPKEGKWDAVAAKRFPKCVIKNVCYGCDEKSCLWYDTKRQGWRVVRGLAMLNRNPRRGMIEIANYGEKLLILWDKFVHPGLRRQYKHIWCAVIALERRTDDQVWGNIEWADIVRKVPSSYVFLRSRVLTA